MKSNTVLRSKSLAIFGILASALMFAACSQMPAEAVPIEPTAVKAVPTLAQSTSTQPAAIESGGEVPFYARFGENETFDNGEWTVIIFYRQPECIPADFNLNQFFHFPGETSPGAFACTPPTTTSIETWQNGPQTDPAPLIAEMTGRGAVPVWFISNEDMKSAMADEVVTVGELADLPSRLVGAAATFTELLHPTQTNAKPLIQFKAEGSLEDGRPFRVDVSKGAADTADHVSIDISG